MISRKFSKSKEAAIRGTIYSQCGSAEDCIVASEKQFYLLEKNFFLVPEVVKRVQSVGEAIFAANTRKTTSSEVG